MDNHEHLKHWIDYISLSATVASLLQFLPTATLVLTFLWTFGRVVEMFTGSPVHILIKKIFNRDKKP